jgi:hypothetical protein
VSRRTCQAKQDTGSIRFLAPLATNRISFVNFNCSGECMAELVMFGEACESLGFPLLPRKRASHPHSVLARSNGKYIMQYCVECRRTVEVLDARTRILEVIVNSNYPLRFIHRSPVVHSL